MPGVQGTTINILAVGCFKFGFPIPIWVCQNGGMIADQVWTLEEIANPFN
jgi:hypothetical protein